jgi:chromosome segregation ATPase
MESGQHRADGECPGCSKAFVHFDDCLSCDKLKEKIDDLRVSAEADLAAKNVIIQTKEAELAAKDKIIGNNLGRIGHLSCELANVESQNDSKMNLLVEAQKGLIQANNTIARMQRQLDEAENELARYRRGGASVGE